MTYSQHQISLQELRVPFFQNYTMLECYRLYAIKERKIFQTLNIMDSSTAFVYSSAWIQKANLQNIQSQLKLLQQQMDNPRVIIQVKKTKKQPPTTFDKCQFMQPFQLIVNTYGVPNYRQVNPAPLQIITFPFLFAVMFGDLGHGTALICLIIILTQLIPSIKKYKYAFLLFGIFTMYCGLIYNQFFSLDLNLFQSCFIPQEHKERYDNINSHPHSPISQSCIYKFGIDPIWLLAQNKLSFYNSFKMKLAVIIAVAQMALGILLKIWLDLFFVAIPQIIFLASTVGYMDFLIVKKWLSQTPKPSIIGNMIQMAFFQTHEFQFFKGQGDLQILLLSYILLLVIAIICVPLMLFTKPFFLYMRKVEHLQISEVQKNQGVQLDILVKQKSEENYQADQDKQLDLIKDLEKNKNNISNPSIEQDNSIQGIPFSQIFVHQIIETIQFVLGMLSNTASYLRLWALSLAHSQLGQVFIQILFYKGLKENNVIFIFLGFYVFFFATIGVLLCLDVLECFLHALRLHWVQFQNKFYKGEGYEYKPLSFEQ